MIDRVETTVQGKVGTDVTRRVAANGRTWATFRLASTPRYRDARGEFRDGGTSWFTVKTWGDLAENVCVSVRKGMPLLVRGRAVVETWTGETGERWDHVIHADVVGVELGRGTAHYTRTVRERPSDGATGSAAPDAATAGGSGDGGTGNGLTAPDGGRWETSEVVGEVDDPEDDEWAVDPEEEGADDAEDTAAPGVPAVAEVARA